MKLKLDDKGSAVLQDGKPVYIKDDNTEIAFDAAQAMSTISRLNGEAKTHREGKEAAEVKLKAFEGISDPKAALAALETVGKLDQKKLIDAGEVDKVRQEISKNYEAKLAEQTQIAEKAQASLAGEIIGGSFARSKFIAEKFAAQGPAAVEIAQALFAKHFTVKDGKLVATGIDGQTIYSPTVERSGQPASFDEALGVLVASYPHKDSILKGEVKNGGGANGGGGGGGGGGKTMARAEFDKLGPAQAADFMSKGGSLTD